MNARKAENTNKIEVNWNTILFTGFLTSIVFLVIDSIVTLIIIFGFNKETILVLGLVEWILIGEMALVVFWGACIGNIGQSVFISKFKENLLGDEATDKYTIKEATLNSITYYFAGLCIFIYSMILHQIIKIVASTSI